MFLLKKSVSLAKKKFINLCEMFYKFHNRSSHDRLISFTIDTISNLVFWSHLANKLEPWHNVYIIQQ